MLSYQNAEAVAAIPERYILYKTLYETDNTNNLIVITNDTTIQGDFVSVLLFVLVIHRDRRLGVRLNTTTFFFHRRFRRVGYGDNR